MKNGNRFEPWLFLVVAMWLGGIVGCSDEGTASIDTAALSPNVRQSVTEHDQAANQWIALKNNQLTITASLQTQAEQWVRWSQTEVQSQITYGSIVTRTALVDATHPSYPPFSKGPTITDPISGMEEWKWLAAYGQQTGGLTNLYILHRGLRWTRPAGDFDTVEPSMYTVNLCDEADNNCRNYNLIISYANLLLSTQNGASGWQTTERRPSLSGEVFYAREAPEITITGPDGYSYSGVVEWNESQEDGQWSWEPQDELAPGGYTFTVAMHGRDIDTYMYPNQPGKTSPPQVDGQFFVGRELAVDSEERTWLVGDTIRFVGLGGVEGDSLHVEIDGAPVAQNMQPVVDENGRWVFEASSADLALEVGEHEFTIQGVNGNDTQDTSTFMLRAPLKVAVDLSQNDADYDVSYDEAQNRYDVWVNVEGVENPLTLPLVSTFPIADIQWDVDAQDSTIMQIGASSEGPNMVLELDVDSMVAQRARWQVTASDVELESNQESFELRVTYNDPPTIQPEDTYTVVQGASRRVELLNEAYDDPDNVVFRGDFGTIDTGSLQTTLPDPAVGVCAIEDGALVFDLTNDPEVATGIVACTVTLCEVSPESACASAIFHFEIEALPIVTVVTIEGVEREGETDPFPVVYGTSAPHETLLVHLSGTQEQNDTITADSDGNWRWTPQEALEHGAYTFDITDERSATDTLTFTILEATEETPDDETPETPETPDETTVVESELNADGTIPTLHGTGRPGSVITIVIDGIVVAEVVVDENGNWVWSPESNMESGEYTIVVRGAEGTEVHTQIAIRGAGSNVAGSFASVSIERPADKASTAQAQPVLTGVGEAGSVVTFYVNYLEKGQTTVAEDGHWKWRVPFALSTGQHRISAIGEDGRSHAVILTVVSPGQSSTDVRVSSPKDGDLIGDITTIVDGSAAPDSTVTIYVNDVASGTAKCDPVGWWIWTPGADWEEGNHTVMVIGDNGSSDEVSFTVYHEEVETGGCRASSSAPISPWAALWVCFGLWWLRRWRFQTRC